MLQTKPIQLSTELVDRKNKNLDMMLLFATLFSAILTAFIIEAKGLPQPDPADVSLTLLLAIAHSQQRIEQGVPQVLPVIELPEFSPTMSVRWINGLWYTALALSLAAALVAMLAKERLMASRLRPPYAHALPHQETLQEHALSMVDLLPTMLHISLLLFLAGLVVYLLALDTAIAIAVATITGLTVLFYLMTALLGAINRYSPFVTQISKYIRGCLGPISRDAKSRQDCLGDVGSHTRVDLDDSSPSSTSIHSTLHLQQPPTPSTVVMQPIETSTPSYASNGTYIKPAHLIHTADEPLHWKASTRLRQMLARPEIVVAPGVCDGISARCALEAGFTCLYQSGAATTAAKLGQPDLAIATLPDFVQNAGMIANLSYSTPLIADADTGFGGPAMVARTVQMYDRAGVAALHIEDQVQTKRCGHLLGKQVVSTEEFITRIRAAVQARDAIPGCDIVIIARTDSAQVLGMDEAIRRLQAAAAVGADVAFIEGVKTKALLEKTVKALEPTPVLVNVISGGLTPSFTTKEAEQMGAKIIIFSLVSCVAAVHGIREAMALLKKTGTDHASAKGMGPRKFFEVVGLDEVIEIDRRAGGTALGSI